MNLPFSATDVARVDDRAYFDFCLAAAERSQRRIWVSLFICDIRPERDVAGQVLELLSALVDRRSWGVDVRVLLTGDANAADIASANFASGYFLDQSGVPLRRAVRVDGDRLGTHSKFAVFDDIAVAGSQNWTDDGFRLNIEDAVVLAGSGTDRIGSEFLRLWQQGRGMPRAAD